MDEIIVYEKTTCSKCRVALSILDDKGIPYRRVRYHEKPLTAKRLTALIKKLGITPKALMRTADPQFKELKLNLAILKDAEAIQLMVTYPDLMQRPILERGNRAIVGRPSERIIAFLNEV